MQDLHFAAECRLLRRLLCNAYAGSLAYTDDGEAQDNRAFPVIDFLRDSAPSIKAKMEQRGLAALARSEPPAGEPVAISDARIMEALKAASNGMLDGEGHMPGIAAVRRPAGRSSRPCAQRGMRNCAAAHIVEADASPTERDSRKDAP
jgi:hypothetical protein